MKVHLSGRKSLEKQYSTTQLLTTKKPDIINSPKDKFESVLFLPEGENRKEEGGLRTKGYFKKSFEDKPLISIVTVVFNGEKYLEETIQSVINQTYGNVEYIIIDGGSTDGTLEIIKKYEEHIDYWVSEKDSGIYDAMNKGMTLCYGEIIGIVNADDTLYLKTLEEVASAFICFQNISFTYGTVHLMNEDSKVYGQTSSLPDNRIEQDKFKQMPFLHPTMFIKKELYLNIGLYDTQYRLRADYDFVLRILENRDFEGYRLENVTGCFRLGGQADGWETFYENKLILSKYNVSLFYIYINIFSSIIKMTLAKLLPQKILKFLKIFNKSSKNILY